MFNTVQICRFGCWRDPQGTSEQLKARQFLFLLVWMASEKLRVFPPKSNLVLGGI